MIKFRITPFSSGDRFYQIHYRRPGWFSLWWRLPEASSCYDTPALFSDFTRAVNLVKKLREPAKLDEYLQQVERDSASFRTEDIQPKSSPLPIKRYEL